jgi:hypothetical protein
MPAKNVEIVLVQTNGPPVWRIMIEDSMKDEVHAEYLHSHVDLLTGV